MAEKPTLTGVERTFGPDETIVSKTDLEGKITYANPVFRRVARDTEAKLLGTPHGIVRHPDMRRRVLEFLPDTIRAGNGIFAYVVNRCKSGDRHRVFAHVTPTFDASGRIVGCHSDRRLPSRAAIDQVVPIYRELLQEESRHRTPCEQHEASLPLLPAKLERIGLSYDELMLHITA